MDSPESDIDTQSEVRKLQELVKKLERQNEVLRGKQPGTNPPRQRNGDLDEVNTNNLNDCDQEDTDFTGPKLVDGFALDDIEDVNFSDLSVEDDSWLYTSPKTGPRQSKEPLLTWVRQDFDHPSPEVASSRRALISKLDEVARIKHSSSSPVIGGQPFSSRSAVALSRTEDGNHQHSKNAAPAKPGLINSTVDTGTFTKPKGMLIPLHGEGDQPQVVPYVPGSTDISDIENLAKQQEENLRQSVTPGNRKAMRAKHALMEGDTGARLSPSRFDLEGSYLSHHRGSLSSDHSTPPDSPHNSSQNFQISNSTDSRGRRSHPPTPGLQYRSHNSSDSSLERYSVKSDETNLAPEARRTPSRLQQPNYSAPKLGVPSGLAPGLAQQQQKRGISPQRTSGLLTPRKTIAKPAPTSRSSLPAFRRTNAPSPKPPSSDELEESWRDGCF